MQKLHGFSEQHQVEELRTSYTITKVPSAVERLRYAGTMTASPVPRPFLSLIIIFKKRGKKSDQESVAQTFRPRMRMRALVMHDVVHAHRIPAKGVVTFSK